MKIMQVTPSKQWIHFFLSDLWPPTSNILCVCVGKGGGHKVVNFCGDAPPARTMGPLPEVEIFEGELGLDDSGGLHS